MFALMGCNSNADGCQEQPRSADLGRRGLASSSAGPQSSLRLFFPLWMSWSWNPSMYDGLKAGETNTPSRRPPIRAQRADFAHIHPPVDWPRDSIAVQPGGNASRTADARGGGTSAANHPSQRCTVQ